MRRALLTFWNYSYEVYTALPNMYGNINIGDAERTYVRVFRRNTAGLGIDAEPFEPKIARCGFVRSYGLTSSTKDLYYLFNPYNTIERTHSCRLQTSDWGNEMRVINPSSGDVLWEGKTSSTILLPPFREDLVVTVRKTI